jgi:hypothetical protein
MDTLQLTQHAQRRKQQRGISNLQIRLIQFFGEDRYQKGGGTVTFISEKEIKNLRAALDRIDKVALIKTPTETASTVLHMTRPIRFSDYAS